MQTIKSYWDWSPESKVLCIYGFNLCSWKLMNTGWCLHSCKFTVHLWSGSQPPSASQLLLPPHNMEQSDQLLLTYHCGKEPFCHTPDPSAVSVLPLPEGAGYLPPDRTMQNQRDSQYGQPDSPATKTAILCPDAPSLMWQKLEKTSFFFLPRPERRPIKGRNEATLCLEWWDILPITIWKQKCYGYHMAESTRDVGLSDFHQVAEV